MRAVAFVLALAALPASAQAQAKLGIDATPITVENEYLRLSPAPDYWAFAPFVRPQFTSSACSVAAVTGAVNGLAGLPEGAEEAIPDQAAMLDLVGSDAWRVLSAEGGDGVTFAQLEEFAAAAATAALEGYAVEAWQPGSGDLNSISILRERLLANEASDADALLVYFNQGVLTGDWDGPHVAVIGAYDAATGRVLILEVDQEWYIPYWSSDVKLLDAMLKPTSAEHGPLAGGTGGLVHLRPAADG